MKGLRRYWFRLTNPSLPGVFKLGCGVSAYDKLDAVELVRQLILKGGEPQIQELAEDVDVSLLDQTHVIKNMGATTSRGVWFPLGYK